MLFFPVLRSTPEPDVVEEKEILSTPTNVIDSTTTFKPVDNEDDGRDFSTYDLPDGPLNRQ